MIRAEEGFPACSRAILPARAHAGPQNRSYYFKTDFHDFKEIQILMLTMR